MGDGRPIGVTAPNATGPNATAPDATARMVSVDDAGTATLVGGHSASSGLAHFPRQVVCPFTGADDVVERALPRTGRLWLWTAVTAAPPGYTGPVPYGLGVVELDAATDDGPGLRVIGVLTVADPAAWSEGDPVEVTSVRVPGPDGEPMTTWAFMPRAS